MSQTTRLSPGDVAAIHVLNRPFAERLVAGDLVGLLTFYTDDAVVMPPNHPKLQEKRSTAAWQRLFPKVTRAEFIIEEVGGGPDLAFVRGRYVMTLHPEGVPAPVEDHGRHLEIRQRQSDGSWPLWRDIFSSDLAATPGPGMSSGSA